MPQGLNVGRLNKVSLVLSPTAAQRRNFGILAVFGDSDAIDPVERIQYFTDLGSVATTLGTNSPEYAAAQLYFGQIPRPSEIGIARWVRVASSALLKGGILTTSEQAIANFTSILDGEFSISIGGVSQDVTGLDFSLVTNLNGVASEINTVLTGATAAWTGERFTITSTSSGSSASVSYATSVSGGSGTDISSLLKLTSSTALTPIPGFDPESPLEAWLAVADVSGKWYAGIFSASVSLSESQILAVAGYVEGETPVRIFGVGNTDTLTLESSVTTDISSVLKSFDYRRSLTQYSPNVNAISSFLGRGLSVDFNANRSTITMMYKQEPGVVPEYLTETQAQTLQAKNCNVFVNYDNDTAIIQYGTMVNGTFFDEVHGLDWLVDTIQNFVYNLLYQSPRKIPQTDAGQTEIMAAVAQALDEGVNNGLIAPGTWNSDGFGQLARGDFLDKGYYIYSEPMALQAQADREARKAPPIQVAVKLAGAIHTTNTLLYINR